MAEGRATLTRLWEMFLAQYPVLLLPVSAELPFTDNLDLQGEVAYERVWRAQMTQIGLPFMGLPGLSVAMGNVGDRPVGVQVVAGRYREDLCLAAGEAIEAAAACHSARSRPIMPVSQRALPARVAERRTPSSVKPKAS